MWPPLGKAGTCWVMKTKSMFSSFFQLFKSLFEPRQLIVHDIALKVSSRISFQGQGGRIRVIRVQNHHGHVVVSIIKHIFFVTGEVLAVRVRVIGCAVLAFQDRFQGLQRLRQKWPPQTRSRRGIGHTAWHHLICHRRCGPEIRDCPCQAITGV